MATHVNVGVWELQEREPVDIREWAKWLHICSERIKCLRTVRWPAGDESNCEPH